MTTEQFHTPISSKLYSDENLFLGDETTDFDQFSTPLKKLSNNSMTDIKFKSTKGRSEFEILKGNNQDDKILPTHSISKADGDSTENISLKPLGDVSFKLYRTKLTSDSLKTSANKTNLFNRQATERKITKEPIYYKPPSSNTKDSQYGIKNFLPPNFNKHNLNLQKSKVPITGIQKPMNVNRMVTKSEIDDDNLDEDNEFNDIPTGVWTNPVVKEALKRQVNKEYEFKKLASNVVLIILLKLVKSLVNFILTLYEQKKLPFQKLNAYYPPIRKGQIEVGNITLYAILITRLMYCLFVLNCLISIYKLLKRQDQSYDLPLNDKQRILLGLEINESSKLEDDNEEEAELALKERRFQAKKSTSNYRLPKYNKLNAYSMYNFSNPQNLNKANQSLLNLRSSSDLTLAPNTNNKLLHRSLNVPSNSLSKEEDEKLRSKFSRNFNIEFNCSDDEELVDNGNILGSLSTSAQSSDRNIFRKRYDF